MSLMRRVAIPETRSHQDRTDHFGCQTGINMISTNHSAAINTRANRLNTFSSIVNVISVSPLRISD